ncbi:actin filament organization protein-like protein App1-like protein [Massarina eburnea CBS 473.64]|uniref:Actin filament organization protein-like protein App1-like protein n=1 Tax=Massarina eburnea CBS 473.64 TaxID=1395130 RepID=A0A6A6S7L6_9PLEO|nr:actin filament organization protein-like protein App1-like protein [Massarina eburnea CBS 473.64]
MPHESAQAMARHVTQVSEETEDERIFRSKSGFPDFESKMPALPHRFQYSLKDNLSSYLGTRNPFYEDANPTTDYVWLLDNTAYQNRIGRWKAEFVAAYFSKNSGKDLSESVATIIDMTDCKRDDETRATIAKRLQPFADSILPAHAVHIDLQGVDVRLGPSGRDGISSDELAIPGHDHKDATTTTTQAIKADATPMNTYFAKPKGWAIISDIDDTIKKTLTASPVGILKTTFAEEPEPIPGMPELYAHIKNKLDNPPFWYLSASPYNLYPFLRQFRDQYYPPGSLILREASWMNLAGFLANLTQGTQAYKVSRMDKVYEWFPKRRFVCIGDSTQKDPEAYAEMYRKHPKWIKAIYIRKVMGVAEMDEQGKNSEERFEMAFEGVPRAVWRVFVDPGELVGVVDGLVEAEK